MASRAAGSWSSRAAGRSSCGAQLRRFRTRRDRALELTTAKHTYPAPGRYTIAVKVVDIFGNDTMSLTPVTVG